MTSNGSVGRFQKFLRPVWYLSNNRVSQTGVVLTTASVVTLISLYTSEFFGISVGPYVGIIAYLILPGIFVFGLMLIPVGIGMKYRRERFVGKLPVEYPKVDLRDPRLRETATFIGVMTALNLLIFLTATYRGVHYMETTQFCGQTCHTVMQPEYTAFVNSPHSRVGCVQCHIGPGAPWFVRSKLSGTRQILAVTFKTYSRPIPSPVRELRPARETCEQCHWPQRFSGDKFWVRTKFSDDEKNTPLTTILVLKIGGRDHRGAQGIHGRHLDVTERISYVATDDRRQVLPVVSYVDDNGKTVEYFSTEVKPTPAQLAKGENRKMDCVDCHNRPTHVFLMPERAMDIALSEKRISPDLPFIKKKAVELLRADYPDRNTASQRIPAAIAEYYRTTYPEIYANHRAVVETAADQVKGIYLRYVFPDMKVTWGTYPNNLGHEDFLGCFRCHDGNHKSKDGKEISSDCASCHTILAMDEANPKVLADLGLK